MKEETNSATTKTEEYLEIVNDLKLINSYPNLAKFLVIPKQRREERLKQLLA